MANIALLTAVIAFVSQQPSGTASNAILGNSAAETANPLDELSSADIAVHISRLAQMDVDEVTQVANTADSESAQLSVAPADNVVVAKPQLVNTVTKSAKDIKTYVTVAGDTVDTLAARFGVTSDSIKWSNGLSSNSLKIGTQLTIPPVNGIVYVAKPGDTADSLAAKFSASKEAIINDNDADVNGIRPGQKLLIRDGVLKAAAARVTTANYTYAGFSFGTGAIYGYNGYTRGYCTWYVASRIAIPANWGNAVTWDDRARLSGWTVSSTPRPGSIGQTNSTRYGPGHVGVVEAVSEDGSMIKYSDMNGISGWGRVGYSDWVPVHSVFQNFIYR